MLVGEEAIIFDRILDRPSLIITKAMRWEDGIGIDVSTAAPGNTSLLTSILVTWFRLDLNKKNVS